MYFVVFLINDRFNIVVPKTWIKNIDDQIEKFINNGLNSSQKMLCYWTTDPSAFDNGQPKIEFVPDPAAGMAVQFPSSGWYICKIKRFKVNYEEAQQFIRLRRNIEPPVYNEERLYEEPMPDITIDWSSVPWPSDSLSIVESNSPETSSFPDAVALAATPGTSSNRGSAGSDNAETSTSTTSFAEEKEKENETTICLGSTAPKTVSSFTSIDTEMESEPVSVSTRKGSSLVIEETNLATTPFATEPSTEMETESATIGTVEEPTLQGSTSAVIDTFSVAEPISSVTDSTLANNESSVDSTHNSVEPSVEQSTGSLQCLAVVPYAIQIFPHHKELEHAVDIKPLLEPVRVTSNATEVENILQSVGPSVASTVLDQHASSDDEDITEEVIYYESEPIYMTYKRFAMPLPPPADELADVLIKREGDVVSNNIPFRETTTGRIYKIGSKYCEIPCNVIENFKRWNTGAFEMLSEDIDRKFVAALLLVLLEKEKLANEDIDDDTSSFIRDLFSHRTQGQARRMDFLNEYIHTFCLEFDVGQTSNSENS